MSDERYQRAKEVFLMACDLAGGERQALLEQQCADDQTLRAEVDSLLAYYEQGTSARAPMAAEQGAAAAGEREWPATDDGRLGSYRLVRELGQGGMGTVYLAVHEHDHFRRRVAIKVLKRGMDTGDILRRFDLERQVLAALSHPNIARLFDGGETPDGRPYFVMEYIEGQPLDQYCDTSRLSIAERLVLFEKVCLAVHHAHQNLVVHRDLKPANILVSQGGEPKLLDFGIAKLINPEMAHLPGDPTAPEMRVMTPQYASPEQVRGEPVATASDVYSLGVMLYELVSGHRPYRLQSRVREDIRRVVCEQDPEKPSTAVSRIEETDDSFALAVAQAERQRASAITPESVSRTREGRPDRLRRRLAGDIDNIVLMAMRKEPHRRYASAEQFAADIRRHLEGLPVIARPDTLGYRAAKFVHRNRTAVTAAALIAVLLVAGVAGTTWGWQTARTERAAAVAARDAEATERARAERRFGEVRSMARTLMYDLHDEIDELDGALPARQLLVTTALAYLDGLSAELGDDKGLKREVAAAHDRVGSLRGGIRNPSLGDTPGALESYGRGLRLREELLAAAPADRELAAEVASSRMHVGDMLLLSGQVAEARGEYRQSLQICESLADADPSYRRHLALALNNIGAALLRSGLNDEARIHYDRSLRLRRQLAKDSPDDLRLQRDLSVALLRSGGQLAEDGDHERALDAYEEAAQVRRRLLALDSDSGRAQRDLAMAEYFIARELLALGRIDEAGERADAYLLVSRQRAETNPMSARDHRDHALAFELLGDVHSAAGEWADASASYERFAQLAADLTEIDPGNTAHRSLLANAEVHLGETAVEGGDHGASAGHFGAALEILEGLRRGDAHDVRWREQRAYALRRLGAALVASGSMEDGQGRLEESCDELRALVTEQPRRLILRQELAEGLQALAALEAAGGRNEAAVALLDEAIAALDAAAVPEATADLAALRRSLEDARHRYAPAP